MIPSSPGYDDAAGRASVPAPDREAPGAPRAEPPLLGACRVLVLIAALAILALGLGGGVLGLALGLLGPGSERLASMTVSVSVLALTAGLGLPLAWQAWQAIQGRPSATFQPWRPWPLLAAFLLAVAAGQAVLEMGLLPALLFPPLHVVAAVTPPLFILALVARGLGDAGRWRDVTLQLSSGAFLATPLAFLLEAAFILALAGMLVAGLALRPGGLEMLQALTDNLASGTWLQDPDSLLPLLKSPVVIAAVLLVAALFVPLVEELAKSLGVGLVSYRHPDARQAMLWGLAGGAGFAMFEGLFNTTGSLQAWGPVIVLRVGATLLHCTAGALMGLAWRQLLVLRRWGPAVGLYAAAIVLHAAWNAVSVGVAFMSLGTMTSETSDVAGQLTALGVPSLIAVLIFLAAGMGLLLVLLTRRVARGSRPAGDLPPASPPAGA